MEKLYYDDYTEGEVFISPGRTITETDIVMFAALTGDWHPLHTNDEYAKKTPFKERIAHGMLGLVIGSALMVRAGQYVILPKSFIAFYGMENVRFTAPIKIGDTIHCEAKIKSLTPKGKDRGIIEEEQVIKNHRGEDLIVFTTKILAGRKPAS